MSNETITSALLDGRFEEAEDGILIPTARTIIRGVWSFCKRGEPVETAYNMVVTQGRDYLLATGLKGSVGAASWFVAPFTNDVSVQTTWTASNFTATAGEVTNYESVARPTWTGGAVASGAVNSFLSKAEIKSTVDSLVIRGAALLSVSAKSSTSGTMFAAARFPSPKTLDTDEILDIGYGIQLLVAT